MTTITFDKLSYIEHLKTAGIDEKQARAHAFALDDALKDTVATKGDLALLRGEIKELELRMTIKFGGMLFVAVGVIITAMKFLLLK